jgi:hypothetical protein
MKRIILFLLFVSVSSVAAEGTKKEKKKNYSKTQEVSFDSTDIDGLVRSPDGAYLNQKKGIKFLPLFQVEKSFDREIKSSVEYLR